MKSKATTQQPQAEKPVPLQTLYNQVAKTLGKIIRHPDVSPAVANFLIDFVRAASEGHVAMDTPKLRRHKRGVAQPRRASGAHRQPRKHA